MSARLNAASYLKAMGQPKRNKFNARKTVVDGITFDSAKEARRWQELKLLERAGKISHLERQVTFKLTCGTRPVLIRSKGYPNGRQAVLKLDFAYFDGQHRILEDVKGGEATKTPVYKLKKAILEAMYPAVKVIEV